jgi:hypothetical protein
MSHPLLLLLKDTSPGSVPQAVWGEIISLLKASWSGFEGSELTRMEAWKLDREMPSDLSWNPPIVSFVIRRHGGTALGSARGEKQRWEINLEQNTARQQTIGFFQARPREPKFDVDGLAARIAQAIARGRDNQDSSLRDIVIWKNDEEVHFRHGVLIPNTSAKLTVQGRRARFREAMLKHMTELGWQLDAVRQVLVFKKTT